MYEIIAGRLADFEKTPGVAEAMFRLRHHVFFETLQWDVPSINGMEIDDYDDEDAYYILSRSLVTRDVEGCVRLRPTLSSYMLKDTFPMLLDGQAAPERADLWEISRFAVVNTPYADARYGFGDLSRDIITEMVDFAVQRDISGYVTVTSTGLQRITDKLGYHTARIGQARRIGRVRTVALDLPIDANARRCADIHRAKRIHQPAA
jgi:acyl homoserine lactone synthase